MQVINGSIKFFVSFSFILLFSIFISGCSLLPNNDNNASVLEPGDPVTVEDESYTTLSEDDSMEVIEAEIDATIVDEEDIAELEKDFNVGVTE
ncbi:MAG: hypothetical protein H6772_03330 [Pseudomonadales bacterium]|nr:hypothetical protein [Pseudomonadales bacterium]